MLPTRWPWPSRMRMQGDEPVYLVVFRSRELEAGSDSMMALGEEAAPPAA